MSFALESVAAEFPISSLKGDAKIVWKTKKGIYRFDQVIAIDSHGNAVFETLDDFGTTVLRMYLTEEETVLMAPSGVRRSKKMGFLPVGRDDLVSALLYRTPADSEHLLVHRNVQNALMGFDRLSKKRKVPKHALSQISFLNLKKFGQVPYPKTIKIETKKSSLTIEWQHVRLN